MTVKLAYIMSRFPKLSETFILREMNALRSNGWEVFNYPLILEKTKVIHPEAKQWLHELNHFPWLSWKILKVNFQTFVKRPSLYLSLLAKVVFGNIKSPRFMVRAIMLFPKTVMMARSMKEKEISHIHAHYATHPALVAWVINQLTGIPYSITVHAHDIYVDRSMLETKVDGASFVVAISKFNQEFLAKHVGEWSRNKTFVIHCGIDMTGYSSATSPQYDGLHVVSIGSLQPYKGMPHLIEACKILKDRNIPVQCTIIGDGEDRQKLEALIIKSGVSDTVLLAGAKTQAEVADILRIANCYAQPSVITASGKMEGIPVALMEALAASLPSIATNISGIPELIRHGSTGYLVPPGDAHALADAIEYVYAHPEEAAKVSSLGRLLVNEEFEIKKNISQLAELFTRQLGKS